MLASSVLPPVSKHKCFPPLLARTTSYTLLGLTALPVEVEIDVSRGLPSLTIVGLPDRAVKEAKERVRSAILNSQYELPSQRLTINLAPADIKKEGALFDLAVALGVLAASGQVDPHQLACVVALGELALDGTVRPVHGVLPIALALRGSRRRLLVPSQNAPEAALVAGVSVVPVESLREAAERLADGLSSARSYRRRRRPMRRALNEYAVDFAEVKGQAHAKRALEVGVAGGHHMLLIGPPGSGKTMLAHRIPTIQPELSIDEALEVTTIHSVAGQLTPPPAFSAEGGPFGERRPFGPKAGGGVNGRPLLTQRPFRNPHHTTSAIALVGGGTIPKPGEISLAHHGVLFLDELPEFQRNALESLRLPLEEGVVTIARAKRSLTFPSRFTLIGAMNPCPCGYLTGPRGRCRCPSTKVATYLAKLSGPLLDRIDLHIEVPAVPLDALTKAPPGESSASIRARIMRARRRQRTRLKRFRVACNAQLRHRDLAAACPMTKAAEVLLASAMRELVLSARSYDKIRKIARTIADLASADVLEASHVAEAIQYRALDRQLWV